MRILVVSQYFWPENFRINDLVRSLVEKGVEVEVLTGKPNYPEGLVFPGYRAWGCQKETWLGTTLYRVPLMPRGKDSGLRLAINYLSFIVSGLLFGPLLLRRRRFDVIFVYGLSPILLAIPALLLKRIKGCPLILWVQDLWPESMVATGHVSNRWLVGWVENVVRFIYRQTDLLLVQSKAFIPPVSAMAPGKTVIYYPNSVDEVFAVTTNNLVMDIPGLNGGFPVMFAGNIGAAQAVEVIVEAATLLREFSEINFIVLGQGSRWEWMRSEVKSRNLTNLHLPGRFPVAMMPGFMQKASALLVTLADREIFSLTVPSKVQAYMASGRPILACLNGEGASLVTTAGAGLAVPSEDSKALAEAVLKLYRMSPDERDMLGSNGRRYYQQYFHHDQLVDQLMTYFDALSKNKEVEL